MKNSFNSCIAILFGSALILQASDWNQWRGPNRNGVLPNSPKLADVWSTDGPPKLWESAPIPGNDMGGHGSAVASGDKVFMSVVWHTDVPTQTRRVDSIVMRKLGSQRLSSVPPEIIADLEKTVFNLSSRIRGSKLDAVADEWIEKNLDRKQKINYSGYIKGRFKKGKKNIPFADYEKLEKVRDKVFPSHAQFIAWVDTQSFSEFVREQVIKAVPPTKRVAKDTIVCVSLKTGKILWRAEAPGEPRGRNCSSTPAVADGFVYGAGSTHFYCVDAETGNIKWATEMKRKGIGSSPLVIDGVVVLHANIVTAYDAKTGKQLWSHDKMRVTNSSPVAWKKNGKNYLISHTRDALVAMNPRTGEIIWTLRAGGDSTPAIQGDLLTVQCRKETQGFIAVQLHEKEPKQLWSNPFEARRTQSSPIIDGDVTYLIDNSTAYCHNLRTGKLLWQQKVPASITSPVMADGKFFIITDRGNNLTMYRPQKESLAELGKTRIKALYCPSPCVTDGYVVLRQLDKLVCYDITEGAIRSN
tara:strand:- start:1210 stop:2790 length:1581 start_codon:yes stop_codon:yes gene_type:complete